MSLDLSAVVESAEAVIEIKHPVTGAPTGASITVAGPEHPKRKKILFDRQRTLRARFQKSGKVQFTDPAEEEEELIQYLADCTLGWAGFTDGGKELKFSPQAAAELYAKPELAWLRGQVSEALESRENFITSSSAA